MARTGLPLDPPPAPDGAWRFVIDDFVPTPLNVFTDRHWSVRKRAKDHDKAIVAMYFHLARIPRATGKRRVHLWVGLAKGQRQFDVDALFKSTLDALKTCGAIVDDGPNWCELAPVRYGRGERQRTVIDLEDLG